MDIKGSVNGYSSFLSRFTDAAELVCVTLMCNKEGVDFTNLGRRIAGAYGDLLSTGYDDNRLFLLEGQFSAAETVSRLETALKERNIPVFAKFDHGQNAADAGLSLRPTTVLVFGSPQVGTGLMAADQSVSLELPLRISVWEDEAGSTWLAFPRLDSVFGEYGLENHPAVPRMQALLEQLFRLCRTSGILHNNAFHHIGHMLTGIAAFLQVGVNLPPGNDFNRVCHLGVKPAHGVNE